MRVAKGMEKNNLSKACDTTLACASATIKQPQKPSISHSYHQSKEQRKMILQTCQNNETKR